jgi:hypothetical protein
MAMKNVTITLDEETAQWVRVQAAIRETSVSRLVGEILKQERLQDADYQSAMTRFLAREPETLKMADAKYPERERLYDRSVLR